MSVNFMRRKVAACLPLRRALFFEIAEHLKYILAILIKVYGTVIGWYHASVAWLTEAGQYASSFWPFLNSKV